jgi:hypothetical protein
MVSVRPVVVGVSGMRERPAEIKGCLASHPIDRSIDRDGNAFFFAPKKLTTRSGVASKLKTRRFLQKSFPGYEHSSEQTSD